MSSSLFLASFVRPIVLLGVGALLSLVTIGSAPALFEFGEDALVRGLPHLSAPAEDELPACKICQVQDSGLLLAGPFALNAHNPERAAGICTSLKDASGFDCTGSSGVLIGISIMNKKVGMCGQPSGCATGPCSFEYAAFITNNCTCALPYGLQRVGWSPPSTPVTGTLQPGSTSPSFTGTVTHPCDSAEHPCVIEVRVSQQFGDNEPGGKRTITCKACN